MFMVLNRCVKQNHTTATNSLYQVFKRSDCNDTGNNIIVKK